MGRSFKCSICDNELDSAADIGQVHQFCEECIETKQDEIQKYSQSDNAEKYSSLREIKGDYRRRNNL